MPNLRPLALSRVRQQAVSAIVFQLQKFAAGASSCFYMQG
jgi:hypothetical protein